MMHGWVYRFFLKADGRSYVGSTVDLRKRRNLHVCLLRSGRHSSVPLQNAWNKYGEDAFGFEVLQEGDFESDEQLRAKEGEWMGRFPRLLNTAPVAGSILGIKRRPDTVEKMKRSLIGQKRTDESRQRISEAQRRRDPATRNIAALLSGAPATRSAKHREAIGRANVRRARKITIDGESKSASEWAATTGVDVGVLRQRLKNGQDPSEAIIKKIRGRSPMLIAANGAIRSVREWSRLTGLSRSTIFIRLQRGWPPEDAVSKPAQSGKPFRRNETSDMTNAAQELACSAGACEVDP